MKRWSHFTNIIFNLHCSYKTSVVNLVTCFCGTSTGQGNERWSHINIYVLIVPCLYLIKRSYWYIDCHRHSHYKHGVPTICLKIGPNCCGFPYYAAPGRSSRNNGQFSTRYRLDWPVLCPRTTVHLELRDHVWETGRHRHHWREIPIRSRGASGKIYQ